MYNSAYIITLFNVSSSHTHTMAEPVSNEAAYRTMDVVKAARSVIGFDTSKKYGTVVIPLVCYDARMLNGIIKRLEYEGISVDLIEGVSLTVTRCE